MKRKKKAELGTFSASAIDLFASALGAFIIITVVLFPYFPNLSPDPLKAILDRLRSDKVELEQEVASLHDQNTTLTNQNANLQNRNSSQAATIQQQQSQIDAAQQTANQAQAALLNASKRTTLLGIETDAQKIAIVLDLSGSMLDNSGASLAKSSIEEILLALGTGVELSMIGYNGNKIVNYPLAGGFDSLDPIQQNASGDPILGPLRKEYYNQADNWLADADGSTPTLEAMLLALSYSPEAVILITDGQPNGDWQDVERQISQSNRANSKKSEIHAVAVGSFYENASFTQFLGRLTSNNDGNLAAAITN